MFLSIIGTIIGLAAAIVSFYYVIKEKADREAVKIYSVIGCIGTVLFIAMLIKFFIEGM